MRREAGLTVIDAAMMCFLALAVIALLLSVFSGGQRRYRHRAAQATAQEFSDALKAYEADFGNYAPVCDPATSDPADKAALRNR